MKQKRKSKFFTFIFSFLPGAAEMYMGFMKNGVSLMGLFFLPIIPTIFFGSMEFLLVLTVVIWFFGFFHARNYAGMNDEEFMNMEDKYIWDEYAEGGRSISLSGKKARMIAAAILIIVGVGQLWNYFSDLIYSLIPGDYWDSVYPIVSEIPQVIVAILFIIAGIFMIKGKKKELSQTPDVEVKRIAEMPQKPEAPVEVVDNTQSREA